MQYSPSPVISSLLGHVTPSTPYPQRTTAYVLLSLWHTKYHTPIKQQSPAISCSLLTLHLLTPKVKTKYPVPRGSRHSEVQPVLTLFVNAIKICLLYSKYLTLAKILKNIFMSWLCLEFFDETWIYTELNQHFLPVQPSFYGSTCLLYFLIITSSILFLYSWYLQIQINWNPSFFTAFTQTLLLCLRLPTSISQTCFWIQRQSADYTNRLYLNHLH